MVPAWRANEKPLITQSDGCTEFSAALQDWRVNRFTVSPRIPTQLKDVDRTCSMVAVDRLTRCADGEKVTIDGDRPTEVGVRIELGVLDRIVAHP